MTVNVCSYKNKLPVNVVSLLGAKARLAFVSLIIIILTSHGVSVAGSSDGPDGSKLDGWGALPQATFALERYSRQSSVDGVSSNDEKGGGNETVVYGLRLEKIEGEYADNTVDKSNGVLYVKSDTVVTLRFFGRHFSPTTQVAFTRRMASTNSECLEDISMAFRPDNDSINAFSALFTVKLEMPLTGNDSEFYYLCLNRPSGGSLGGGGGGGGRSPQQWVHQGKEPWLQIRADKIPDNPYLLPMWLQITCLVVLLCLSGLFSGLNLGLMTLDPTELKIVLNCGSPKEQGYARSIMPLRKQGNFLLCTLLLGNVLVNTTLTILMDDLTSGLVAVVASTMGIVIFGEIIPQAICSRHGMAVGAHTIWLTKFFMVLTFPLSYPISRMLDCFLGAEIGHVYNRERLMELIKVTHGYNDLEQEEVNIISGALELKKKTVGSIMTPLNDVFMLPYDSVLDFDTVSEIMRQGYTRVPVYDGSRTNVVALLNIKDLALVDPDDNTPVKTLCKFYNHHVRTVFDDTTLDVMLDEFKKGRSHMAFVQRVITEDEGDPFYETVGVITLEDVIEEVIQSEIEDETDVTADNRRRLRRRDVALAQHDIPVFTGASAPQYQSMITPQLQLATFQFLSTTLEPFREELIAPVILRRLLRYSESARFLKEKSDADNAEPPCLYTAGRPADYFILILEGRVEVKVGTEHLLFQSGPFTYFGISALSLINEGSSPAVTSPISTVNATITSPSSIPPGSHGPDSHPPASGVFIPDFTVYPVSDLLYLYITRAQYVAAFRASVVERSTVIKSDGVTMKDDGTLTALERQAVDWQRALQVKRGSLAVLHGNDNRGAEAAATAQAFKKTSLLANSNVSLNDVQKGKSSADALLPVLHPDHPTDNHHDKTSPKASTPIVHSPVLQRQASSRRTSKEEHVP